MPGPDPELEKELLPLSVRFAAPMLTRHPCRLRPPTQVTESVV